MKEQRVHARIATLIPCVVQARSGLEPGQLVDVSRGGAQLEASSDVAEQGEAIGLSLGLRQDALVQLGAQVVRKHVQEGSFRYGLRFTVLENPARQELYAFIDDVAKGPGGGGRQHARITHRLELELGQKSEFKKVMKDVSQGGVGMVTQTPVVLDEVVSIDVRTPGLALLSLPGRVVYVRALPDSSFAVGVQFDELKPETKVKLEQFLSRLR